MNHLDPEDLVDELDGELAAERRTHLETCEACRRQLQDSRALLSDVRTSQVPEPSPLFWTHFSHRVRQAIADEPRPRATWLPVWAGWRILAPTAALALLVAVLVNAVPRAGAPAANVSMAAVDIELQAPLTDEGFDDASWRLVSALAGDLDLDAPPVGFVAPGSIERAASDLEPAERAELLRLLRAELGRPES